MVRFAAVKIFHRPVGERDSSTYRMDSESENDMYCLSCGKAVTPGLTYCNHCGVRLTRAESDGVTKSSELKPETLVGAIAAVFIFGLAAIIGLMAGLKYVFDQRGDIGLIVFFLLLSFLAMFVVEGVFIWMLLTRKKRAKDARGTKSFEEQSAKELQEAKAGALPAPALSVTEHTTHTLEAGVSQQKTE
jgi:hypothetical protein